MITYFQYQKYTRFRPPSAYDYQVSDSIDINYHDPVVLQQYYQNAYDIGNFARTLWHDRKIDVRFTTPEDLEVKKAVQYYGQLVSTTHYLEDMLVNSKKLKDQGFSNQDILLMEQEGISPVGFLILKNKQLEGLKRGDSGRSVWELQKLLVQKGYSIPVDGIFNVVTEDALKDFQQEIADYPSGIVDDTTLRALVLHQ